MGLWVRHIEKERILFISMDKIHTVFRNLGGQLGLIGQSIDDSFVLVEWQWSEIENRALLRMQRPHIVGVGDAEPLVESVFGGKEIGVVAQVPFAIDGRMISICLLYTSDAADDLLC